MLQNLVLTEPFRQPFVDSPVKKLILAAIKFESIESRYIDMEIVDEKLHKAQVLITPDVIDVLRWNHNQLPNIRKHLVWAPLETSTSFCHEASSIRNKMQLGLATEKVQLSWAIKIRNVCMPVR